MPKTVSELITRERKEPDWIIPGWLKRGNSGLILGEPKKTCKSWLMLNLAWQLSEGLPVWGVRYSSGEFVFKPPRPMRVVYFTQEDTEDDIQDRLLSMVKGGLVFDDNNRFLIVTKDLSLQLDTAAGIKNIDTELKQTITQHGQIDLVMFDPMRRMHRGNENDSQVINDLWLAMSAMYADYNCAGLFAHHISRPNERTDRSSPYGGRGSTDIYGGGDAFMNVVPDIKRGRSTASQNLIVYFETKRSKPIEPINLRVLFGTGTVEFGGFRTGRPSS